MVATHWLSAQPFQPPPEAFGIDETAGLILVRAEPEELTGWRGLTLGGEQVAFAATFESVTYDRPYPVTMGGADYELYFTRLPLLSIDSQGEIVDDPKVPATVAYSEAGHSFTETAGVEYRGKFSLYLPKKTLDLEFDDDVTFGGMRVDDDWVVDAVYNEPLRVNAFVGHKLWLAQYELPYAAEEGRAKPGPDVLFAETFLNGRYHGITMIGEQVDRKLLRLKKERDGLVRGELFKGDRHAPGTAFDRTEERPTASNETWSGYEMKYPDVEDGGSYDNLLAFHEFVTTSSDADFRRGISNRFDLDNAIDILLFTNLLGLSDNASRNIYTARYAADSPYFNIPWDLDGSFGNHTEGFNYSRAEDWYGNGLHRRLTTLNPDNFNGRLCTRYRELRDAGIYTTENLMAQFGAAMKSLRTNGAYRREALRWPEALNVERAQVAYTEDWIDRRLAYMDEHVCSFVERETTTQARTLFTLSANPATDRVVVTQTLGNISLTYELYDLLGTQLRFEKIGLSFVIDLSELPTGTYIVKVGATSQLLVVR